MEGIMEVIMEVIMEATTDGVITDMDIMDMVVTVSDMVELVTG